MRCEKRVDLNHWHYFDLETGQAYWGKQTNWKCALELGHEGICRVKYYGDGL